MYLLYFGHTAQLFVLIINKYLIPAKSNIKQTGSNNVKCCLNNFLKHSDFSRNIMVVSMLIGIQHCSNFQINTEVIFIKLCKFSG